MSTRFPSSSGSRVPLPKLEVIQDLDLYYIRQLAHNNKDYDLEQKIDVEIKIREGSSRLLAACKHPQQSLEAAKTLLTSNERMTSYLTELQRRKEAGRDTKRRPHLARLCVSDIRMALIWKEEDHFRNRGDFRRFAVFCLVRVGADVFDTTLVNPVDRSMTDVCFDDVLLFEQVAPDFTCTLEVYSHVLHEDLSIASTPRRIRQSLHSSISRTMGRSMAASLKDELNGAELSGPQFKCIARTQLRVQDVDDTVRSHDLSLSGREAKTDLPLFGQLCCRLAAQPNVHLSESATGAVALQRGGEGEWRDYWATLRGYHLRLWPTEESSVDADHEPVLTVPVNKDTGLVVGGAAYELTLRPERGDRPQVALRLSSDDERDIWWEALQAAVRGSKLWRRAGQQQMTMLTPSARLSGINSRRRQRSLYEHVSLKEEAGSPELPPMPLPRPRAQSASALASFIRWGSLRSRRKLNS